jgi:hypothetical protein
LHHFTLPPARHSVQISPCFHRERRERRERLKDREERKRQERERDREEREERDRKKEIGRGERRKKKCGCQEWFDTGTSCLFVLP